MRLEPARPMVVDPPVAASATLIAELVLRNIDWLCGSTALTCSARSGLQAETAQRARRMRLESPASPPALSCTREKEQCPAPSPARGRRSNARPPLPRAGEGWGEGVRLSPRSCFS